MRVVGREADGAWIPGNVAEPERPRVPNQGAQDASATRQLADRPVRLVVDAVCDEPLELGPAGVDHAERGVPRPGQRRSGFGHMLKHSVERKFRSERDTRVDQRTQATLPRAR